MLSTLQSRDVLFYATRTGYHLSKTRDRRGSSRDNTEHNQGGRPPPKSASLISALDGMP